MIKSLSLSFCTHFAMHLCVRCLLIHFACAWQALARCICDCCKSCVIISFAAGQVKWQTALSLPADELAPSATFGCPLKRSLLAQNWIYQLNLNFTSIIQINSSTQATLSLLCDRVSGPNVTYKTIVLPSCHLKSNPSSKLRVQVSGAKNYELGISRAQSWFGFVVVMQQQTCVSPNKFPFWMITQLASSGKLEHEKLPAKWNVAFAHVLLSGRLHFCVIIIELSVDQRADGTNCVT